MIYPPFPHWFRLSVKSLCIDELQRDTQCFVECRVIGWSDFGAIRQRTTKTLPCLKFLVTDPNINLLAPKIRSIEGIANSSLWHEIRIETQSSHVLLTWRNISYEY